jgi:hypothetical protein
MLSTNMAKEQKMPQKKTDYLSYLIRLRRVDNGGHPLWRITLEAPGGAERHTANFGNLEALVDFLRMEMEPASDAVEKRKESHDLETD